uniref:Uncharacterized protein n=1 Tax=Salix viminalis TaxID=40686 RepID=A0A6N2MZ21_SALVM
MTPTRILFITSRELPKNVLLEANGQTRWGLTNPMAHLYRGKPEEPFDSWASPSPLAQRSCLHLGGFEPETWKEHTPTSQTSYRQANPLGLNIIFLHSLSFEVDVLKL